MSHRIAIVVPGRFHAFDLARELLGRGDEVTLLTNYPRRSGVAFGVPADRIRSFPLHGALLRGFGWLHGRLGVPFPEAWLHRTFGRWAARTLEGQRWDVIHSWSGISEELLDEGSVEAGCRLLMRGSAHVDVQSRLLEEEERRAGVKIDRPSRWMCARERREYDKADHVLVLSSFARRSFEEAGVAPTRVTVMPLGVSVDQFRATADQVADRQRRIRSGAPLRVLYVGSLSFQKGLLDLATMIEALADEPFRFTLTGSVLPESTGVVSRIARHADLVGKVAQADLPAHYRNADVFVFPTIQDGFGMVLAQAKAAGLPILATANCGGPDMIVPGEDGWILPIRDPEAFVRQLRWCDGHRDALAEMAGRVAATFRPRDWSEVAAEFAQICTDLLGTGETRIRRHG
jgi:glycosyltransferase involved in cell wall biosynthesis